MADNPAVKTKTELLKSHGKEQVKQHIVLDANSRPVFVFTAYVEAGEGAPCECTEYVYASPTSTIVIDRQERVYRWKAAWDANFTFDPTADYDPDGDGEL
jgi:hypothetical protein